MFTIEMLEANEGDALWIEYGDPGKPHRMLIDCGYKSTYRTVLKRFDANPHMRIELFVLTHIDGDHIAGSVPFIADERVTKTNVREVWFNSRKHLGDGLGVEQGEYFTHYLKDKRFAWNKKFGGQSVVIEEGADLPVFEIEGGLKLTLLSPTREGLRDLALKWDKDLEAIMKAKKVKTVKKLVGLGSATLAPDRLGSKPNVAKLAASVFDPDPEEPNGSSIAFLAEFTDTFDGGRKKSVLFTGDAHSPVVEASVRRLIADRGLGKLTIDALKVSHHGSKKNTSKDLLDLLVCKHFLFSTNGTKHEHPDRECVARVVAPKRVGTHLYFNYLTDLNKMWKPPSMQTEFRYTAHYPVAGKPGLVVSI
jgi:beta-lactamase superfamily II metal-dependent hydrolase